MPMLLTPIRRAKQPVAPARNCLRVRYGRRCPSQNQYPDAALLLPSQSASPQGRSASILPPLATPALLWIADENLGWGGMSPTGVRDPHHPFPPLQVHREIHPE